MEDSKSEFQDSNVVIHLVGGIILFLLLLYVVQSILSPFIVLAVITYTLYSVRSHAFARTLLIISFGVFFIWFLSLLTSALTPFILSFLVAYLLHPVITRFEKRSIPRWVTSAVVLFLATGTVVFALYRVLPSAVVQITELIHNSPAIIENITLYTQTGRIYEILTSIGIPVHELQQRINTLISSSVGEYGNSFLEGTKSFFTTIAEIFSRIFNIILIPFLSFYILKDFPAIKKYIQSFIPVERSEQITGIVRRIDILLSEYVRGAFTVALMLGIVIGTMLTLVGIQYSIAIGLIMVPLYFIPFFGYFFVSIVTLIAALISGEPTTVKLIAGLAIIGTAVILDMAVLAPKFIGEKIGIHPVVLVFALFVFGTLFGFIGLVVAVPSTAIILMLFNEWRGKSN
ncbi:MAG: AI-2E family transporter [Ignavibacteriales bacterium]|nr:AI-2E family transporter [Ignavibacteriales bacterium]